MTVHLGLVPRVLAFEATTFHPGQVAGLTPARPLASTGGKARRGPMLRVDGSFAGSNRQFERIRSIQQKYLGNPKKEKWATKKLFRLLTERGGAHLDTDGGRRLSLPRRLYGLPLVGAGITGGGFGAAAIIHMNTLYAFVTGKLGLAGLTTGLMATAGLAGTAMTAVVGASLVGIPVVLAGLALRHRAKKVELPHKDQVAGIVAHLLAGEDPARLAERPTPSSQGKTVPAPAPQLDMAAVRERVRSMTPDQAKEMRAAVDGELEAWRTGLRADGRAMAAGEPPSPASQHDLGVWKQHLDEFHPAEASDEAPAAVADVPDGA